MSSRRAALAAAASATAVAFAGCETTAEKSARLERQALTHASAGGGKGLAIATRSRTLKVREAIIVRGREGSAAVVTVRNTSARAVHDVPIAIAVKSAGRAPGYTNTAPGLAHTLTSASYIPAGAQLRWVDDQLPPTPSGATLTATVGDAPTAGAAPTIVIAGTRLFEDPAEGVGAEGTVSNRSGVAQRELVIFATARSAKGIVAAGRALLPQLGAGASTRFQLFFVGDPHGARLQFAAPPATLR